MTVTTRFAPSPTGRLHLGHAYSALLAAQRAQQGKGRFLLRMEDIDTGRCRPEFHDGILEDLDWLGLIWKKPVRCQSEHMDDYASALASLEQQGLLYPCFCSRKEIRQEIENSGHAPHLVRHGPDGPLYPGTCRALSETERKNRKAEGCNFALRLDMDAAIRAVGPLDWYDHGPDAITAQPELFGDVVLARKDTPASYHLAVTIDDHIQGINLVVRGEDLLPATHIHRLLQALLNLDTPTYHHHPLLTDETGKRFAKRDNARTLKEIRDSGISAADIRTQLGFA